MNIRLKKSLPAMILPVLVRNKFGFLSAEVGNVDALTVVVIFSEGVLASNYATGVTIKKNTVNQTIDYVTQEADLRIVYYVLIEPITAGDVVTFAYDSGPGNYTDLSETQDLPTIATRSVTNNVSGSIIGLDFSVAANSQYLTIGV